MRRKIFDIIPPQEIDVTPLKPERKQPKAKITQPSPEEVFARDSEEVVNIPKASKSKGHFWRNLLIALGVLVLAAAAFLAVFVFSYAGIEIWPKQEVVTANAAVVVDVSAAQANLTTHLVPGKIFTEEKSASQQFQTAGKASKEEKARGIIRVYNAYSAANQPLLASTRFVSTDGLLFKSIKREVIPGGTYNKGKLVSGYLDIEVEAAEGGQDYNIAPTTFSIPGFVGTSKYTAFYGKSMAAMAGGFKGEITQISQDDLDKAYTVLAENLKTELQNSLTLKYGSDFVLLKEALSQKIVSNTSSNKLGDQAATFVYQLKVKSKWLGFRKSDLANLAKDVITKDLAKNKQIIESTINISHSVENVDLESGKLILGDKIQAKACFSIDPGAVKLDLAGKPINDARAFLESQPQIEKIKIKSWPFWQKEIPRDLERIEVKINL